VVERQLPKLNVAGSIPVSRSKARSLASSRTVSRTLSDTSVFNRQCQKLKAAQMGAINSSTKVTLVIKQLALRTIGMRPSASPVRISLAAWTSRLQPPRL
jgi:hypothetical protein